MPDIQDVHPAVADYLAAARVAESDAHEVEPVLFVLQSAGDATRHELGDDHPLEFLLGHRRPAGEFGLSLAARGVVVASDASNMQTGDEIVVVNTVMANGAASCVVGVGAESVRFEVGHGLVFDAMFRALGLATPPADCSVAWYWFLVWIAELDAGGVLDEATAVEAAQWHPAIEVADLVDIDEAELAEFVVERHWDLASLTGWAGVRTDALEGHLALGLCPPQLASWFDDGSFSRWLMQQLPGVADIKSRLASFTNSGAHRLLSIVYLALLSSTGQPPSAADRPR